MMKFLLVSLLIGISHVLSREIEIPRNYNGFQLLSIEPKNEEQFNLLKDIFVANEHNYDWWKEPRFPGFSDVLLDAAQSTHLQKILRDGGLNVSIAIPDVAKKIDEEKKRMSLSENAECWIDYCNLQQFYDFINSVSTNSYVNTEVLPTQSTEGNNLPLVRISRDGGSSKKPIIFIDALAHAREWVTGASALWMINQLLTQADIDGTPEQKLLDTYDFYFMPVVNPDGYKYSHEDDRLWRKTRSVNENSPRCRGTDPNRNYDHDFGGSGTSGFPCSETYHGSEAFSEPEIAAQRDIFNKIINEEGRLIHAYICIHSYSQLILLPYGNEYGSYADNYDEQMDWAGSTAQAIADLPDAKSYKHGSISDVLYLAAGGSIDWVTFTHNVRFTVTFESRPSRFGGGGFILPPEEIVPAAQDIWAGIKLFNEDRFQPK